MLILDSVRGKIFITVCHMAQDLAHACVIMLIIFLYMLLVEISTNFKNIR